MLNKKLKRIGSFVASLATACIFAVANSSPSIVRAAGNDTSNAVADLPLIEISMEDANPKETIKNLVIQNRAQFDKNKSYIVCKEFKTCSKTSCFYVSKTGTRVL